MQKMSLQQAVTSSSRTFFGASLGPPRLSLQSTDEKGTEHSAANAIENKFSRS
jgi:hypothetical protein